MTCIIIFLIFQTMVASRPSLTIDDEQSLNLSATSIQDASSADQPVTVSY